MISIIKSADKDIEDAVVEQLKTVFDPEIPVNIYELGLIYELHVDTEKNVKIIMTLTSPNCPVADSILEEVKSKSADVTGVNQAVVELTFDPTWTMDMMSLEAKIELGFV